MANLTTTILLVLGAVFIIQLIYPPITQQFWLDPSLTLTEPWRLLTSIFLHASILHITLNALALYMFGTILETQISRKDYLITFFVAGLLGGLAYYSTYLIGIIPSIPALGASGAIYGILGATAIMLPDMRIFFFVFPMRMREAVVLWIILEFLGTFDISSGVASAAHLGGLFFGLAYGWWIRNRRPEFYQPGWEQSQPAF